MDRAHVLTITVIALLLDADDHAPTISDSSDVRRHPNLIKTLLSVQIIRLWQSLDYISYINNIDDDVPAV